MLPRQQQQITLVEAVQRAGSKCTTGKFIPKDYPNKISILSGSFSWNMERVTPGRSPKGTQAGKQCRQASTGPPRLLQLTSTQLHKYIPWPYPLLPVQFSSSLNLNLFPPPECLGTNQGVTELTQEPGFLRSFPGLGQGPACSSWLWLLRETPLRLRDTACSDTLRRQRTQACQC